MNDAERIWRDKSDEDLLDAAATLDEFTEEGRAVIRAELKRRGLEDPVEQSGETATPAEEPAEPLECLRCRAPLRHLNRDEETRARYLPWGTIPLVDAGGPLHVYACPRCGHVELFLDLPEDEDEEEEQ